MKKLLAILTAAALVLTLAACGENDADTERSGDGGSVGSDASGDTAPASPEDAIIGTWQVIETPYDDNIILVFNRDGSLELGEFDRHADEYVLHEKMTWQVFLGELTLNCTCCGESEDVIEFSIDGNRLRIGGGIDEMLFERRTAVTWDRETDSRDGSPGIDDWCDFGCHCCEWDEPGVTPQETTPAATETGTEPVGAATTRAANPPATTPPPLPPDDDCCPDCE
jgi:hypothetical protein